jgi:hypothetical protein
MAPVGASEQLSNGRIGGRKVGLLGRAGIFRRQSSDGKDMELSRMKTTFIVIAVASPICWSNPPISDQPVLGAMKSFGDFCLSGDPSMEAIAGAAKERHYKLVVDRRLPGPSVSSIVQKTWQIADVTGDFALTVTQNEGLSSDRSVQCGVTLPKGTEKNVESALKDPSRFGTPDQINVNTDGSRTVRWVRHFEWGTAEVGLVNQVPSLQGGSMISVLYRAK